MSDLDGATPCRPKPASDSEIDEAAKLWNELWDGYVGTLEDNPTDAEQVMAAGQKYIDDNAVKISRFNKIFHMRATQAQGTKIKKAIEDRRNEMQTRTSAIQNALIVSMSEKGATQEEMVEANTRLEAQAASLADKLMN